MDPVEQLIQEIQSYHPSVDAELVRNAYQFASRAHSGQKRRSERITLLILWVWPGFWPACSLILPPLWPVFSMTVEDTDTDLEESGSILAMKCSLVDGVTKLSRIEFKSKEEQQVDNLRKMFLAMAKTSGSFLIKLADRRTICALLNISSRKNSGKLRKRLWKSLPLWPSSGDFQVEMGVGGSSLTLFRS